MRDFIVTTIVLLAAAKAKAQAKDYQTNKQHREIHESKKVVANQKGGHKKFHLDQNVG